MFNNNPESVASGISPFTYENDMLFEMQPAPHVSEDYVKLCFSTGRLSQYDRDLISRVYENDFLTRHMLSAFFPERSERSLKRCINKMTDNGFLRRCYCTGTDNGKSVYFYMVSEDICKLVSKYLPLDKKQPVFTDPLYAMRRLAINQFALSSAECREFTVNELPNFAFEVSGYMCRPGYGVTFSGNVGPITLIPVAVRRNTGWPEQCCNMLRLIYGHHFKQPCAEFAIPVCVCEDLLHMKELRKHLASDNMLTDNTLLYTCDVVLATSDILSALYSYDGLTEDGNPRFCQISMPVVPTGR